MRPGRGWERRATGLAGQDPTARIPHPSCQVLLPHSLQGPGWYPVCLITWQWAILQKRRDFLGSPVVGTLRPHYRGCGFNPWFRDLRFCKPWSVPSPPPQKKKKKKPRLGWGSRWSRLGLASASRPAGPLLTFSACSLSGQPLPQRLPICAGPSLGQFPGGGGCLERDRSQRANKYGRTAL